MMGDTSNRSIQVGGSAMGSVFNTGKARDIQLTSRNTMTSTPADPAKQQLAADLQALQVKLAEVKQGNPDVTEAEEQTLLNITTSKPVKERLVKALIEGGRTAIEEFLDNPYVNVVVAAIEGWKS
jgi:hypothetical protein